MTIYRLTGLLSGARINADFINRNPSRRDFVLAFVSVDLVEFLSKSVNDCIASGVPRDQRAKNRHYAAVSTDEIWSWIVQRLELSIDVKLSIEDAYNSVCLCIGDVILAKLLIVGVDHRMPCRRLAGCPNIVSSLLMAR
jgi:hypothetical protein